MFSADERPPLRTDPADLTEAASILRDMDTLRAW